MDDETKGSDGDALEGAMVVFHFNPDLSTAGFLGRQQWVCDIFSEDRNFRLVNGVVVNGQRLSWM